MSINLESLPHPEAPQPQAGGEEHIHDTEVEAPAPKEKKTRQPVIVTALPQAVPISDSTAPTIPSVSTPSPVQTKSAGIIADDVDLIEREWVDRAKAIVEATQDDPHKQKDEISKVKAEYIQKRFKKTIKVDSAA